MVSESRARAEELAAILEAQLWVRVVARALLPKEETEAPAETESVEELLVAARIRAGVPRRQALQHPAQAVAPLLGCLSSRVKLCECIHWDQRVKEARPVPDSRARLRGHELHFRLRNAARTEFGP